MAERTAKPQRCRSSDEKLAKFWKELNSTDVDQLLAEHVAGSPTGKAGCSLSAFLSGTNILSFEGAAAPKLKPMKPEWTGGQTGSLPPPLAPILRDALPQLDQLKPLLREEFTDGQGNFLTRSVYQASDGSFVLVLDYAG